MGEGGPGRQHQAGIATSCWSCHGGAKPSSNLFLPSSSSIPPIHIMSSEPAASQDSRETTAPTEAAGRARRPQSRQAPGIAAPYRYELCCAACDEGRREPHSAAYSIDEDRAHNGAEQARGSLELGRHLVDACLGAVVVLARRPGHADRTDHVVADLNRQTTG